MRGSQCDAIQINGATSHRTRCGVPGESDYDLRHSQDALRTRSDFYNFDDAAGWLRHRRETRNEWRRLSRCVRLQRHAQIYVGESKQRTQCSAFEVVVTMSTSVFVPWAALGVCVYAQSPKMSTTTTTTIMMLSLFT